MTVAARLGSTPAAFAQRTISFPQCWISLVKIGERAPEAAGAFPSGAPQMGVTPPAEESAGATGAAESCSTIVELLIGRADGESGDLRAMNATKPAIRRAASGGRT